MKRHVTVILVLMFLCVVGIVGLQLFWNYQNYKSTVNLFQHDINESLNQAVDQEIAQRHQQIINQFEGWLADTSLITITCDTKNRDSNTVFHINDRHPKFAGSIGISFGIRDFKPKLKHINPTAKRVLIEHFGDKTLRGDLQKGFLYYYTPRLGDSLTKANDESRVNMDSLERLYQKLLVAKNVHTSFRLNPKDTVGSGYLTKRVNTDFGRPYKKEMVWAAFESPDTYFLKTMKLVIISTFVLIAIVLLCFGYTARTLLSQHKLALLKDDFINNMTHELNTPLASIKITAEALKTFAYKPEQQREYLDIIGYQTEKLTDLTGQILNTNRLITASRDNWQPVELNALITKAVHDLSVRFDKQKAIVTYRPGAESVVVYGEPAGLLNVFTNIIDNALKYTAQQPMLTIRSVVSKGWVAIDFADNGIGIPAEYRTKVFEPFFRVPRGEVHDVKGYGLGLNYVSQVVRQHRGLISVRANQPCGSQFSVQLPLIP